MRGLTHITFAGLLAAGVSTAQNSTIRCASGLKMIVSRGTGEDAGLGVTELLVDVISSQIDGSEWTAVEYPAAFENPGYFESVNNGTLLVRQAITDYAEACPDSKMAVFGYSQGAQITTNSFCGSPPIWALQLGTANLDLETVLENSSPLSEEVTKNVVAIVLFGDPTHRNDTSYVHGNATGNGIFYRAPSPACEELGDRIRSYCDNGDPFCDVEAPPSVTAHGTYIQAHGEEVARYVIEQYNNGGQSGNGTDDDEASPSSTASSTPENAASGITPMPVMAVLVSLVMLGLF